MWLQTRQPFLAIFYVKLFIQLVYSLNLSRSLHSLHLKFVNVLLVTIVQHRRIQFVSCERQPYPTHASKMND